MNKRLEAVTMVSGLTPGTVATEENITAFAHFLLDDCIDFANHVHNRSTVDEAVARIKELIKLNYGYPK